MTEQININLASQILQAYAEANAIAEKAKGYASEAVAKAIECGQLLIRQKESLGHGSWLEWLDKNLPGITDRTAQRYMRVAKAALKLSSQTVESNTTHVSYLENAPTLRQAYVALGMFPKPIDKSEQPPDPNKPWVRFTRYLDGFRLWFNKRMDEDPIDTWPENSRRVLKNELKWFAELYERL